MMSPAPAHPIKTVHLIPQNNAIKRLCFDEESMTLRPNLVLVDRHGAVAFEINELGLKGTARDPSRKLVVVWGDSVVFGVRWGWPRLLDEFAPGYQFLNGGIEADPYDNILRRAAVFNQANEVALNIVMLGWHPMHIAPPPATAGWRGGLDTLLHWVRPALPSLRRPSPVNRQAEAHNPKPQATNQRVRTDLLAFLEGTPNTVLITMPTALNRNNFDQDISPYFRRRRPGVFYFIGEIPYSLDVQRYLFDLITERNAITREVAHATGVRLLDLHAIFDTEHIADFRENFFDVLHIRPIRYRKTAEIVYEGIKDLL
jgi:lysophospholipase L1-like esterase